MHKINPIIKGDIINLLFICSSGLNIIIQIWLKNTFRDAEMLFFNKVGIPFSRYKAVVFLFSNQKIDENKTIGHLFKNGSHITVLDQNSIIGAWIFRKLGNLYYNFYMFIYSEKLMIIWDFNNENIKE